MTDPTDAKPVPRPASASGHALPAASMPATGDRLSARIAFLAEADRLKSVERANVLMDLSRRENTAEHCWHVALYAMVFGGSDRALEMILLHDLVEIDAGDQPIFLDHDAASLAAAETAAADRIFGMLPDGAAAAAMWREFESGMTGDAAFAKRMDHVQPLFQVLMAPEPLADHVEIARQLMGSGRVARMDGEWPDAMAAARSCLDGRGVEGDLGRRLAFLAEADRLKSVLRANTLIDASRRENSAEHSWHLALYAWALAEYAPRGASVGRAMRMLILHDLVEIDVGDVPLHSAGGQAHGSPEIMAAEAEAARRIFGLLPEGQGAAFLSLWQEFEAAETPDAIFAKSLDRTQPLVQNIRSGGAGWREFDVSFADIEQRVGRKIARGLPQLWAHLAPQARRFFDD